MRWIVLVALSATFVPKAAGQSPDPLIPDRPDQTESTAVVGAGALQMEAGAVYADLRAGEGSDLTVASLLLRIGLSETLEARVGFAGWSRTADPSAEPSAGVGSVDLGAKLRLFAEGRRTPGLALIGAVTLPVGSEGRRSRRADPGFRLAVSQGVSGRVAIGGNVGVRALSAEGAAGGTETLGEGVYSLVVGAGLAERLGTFLEAFGALGLGGDAPSQHLLDGGLTLLLSADLQLDASAGVGYGGEADDWFVSAGMSWRYPHRVGRK